MNIDTLSFFYNLKVILSILILLNFSACKNKETNIDMLANEHLEEEVIEITHQSMVKPPAPPLPPIKQKEVIKKKIIKDGKIGIDVKKLEKTKNKIDSIVLAYHGYYSKEKLNNNENKISYTLKIRVPSSNFEKLIGAIEKGNGNLRYKEIDARDVTEDFIDLQTRLSNKRTYLIKYKAILKKAKSVKDILEIEEKIRNIEEEIESTQGRLNYLNDLVLYSTLKVEITKLKNHLYLENKDSSFFTKILQSLIKGWFAFVGFLLYMVKLWPFLLITLFILYKWRNIKRIFKHNKST